MTDPRSTGRTAASLALTAIILVLLGGCGQNTVASEASMPSATGGSLMDAAVTQYVELGVDEDVAPQENSTPGTQWIAVRVSEDRTHLYVTRAESKYCPTHAAEYNWDGPGQQASFSVIYEMNDPPTAGTELICPADRSWQASEFTFDRPLLPGGITVSVDHPMYGPVTAVG